MKPSLSGCARLLLFIPALWTGGGVAAGESFELRIDGNHIRVIAPQVHFLSGPPLEKLHNGGVVTYLLQLTVRADRAGKVLARVAERFTLSYDLWEEKFAVTRQTVPARSATNLSLPAAEAWCMDNLALSTSQVPADRAFWVALEYESEEAKDSRKSEGSLTLSSLIDIFSRKPHDEPQVRGLEELGPVRLDDLRKKK